MAHDAATNGDLAAMLQYGDLSQCVDNKQQTVMHTAVQNNNLHLFDFLLQRYPQFATAQDLAGNTVLHVAAKRGFLDIVRKLLAVAPGAFDIRNHFYHQTPLQCAIEYGQWDWALLLISVEPACVYQMDTQNRTLLHYAAFGNNVNFIKCVLKVCPSAFLTRQDTLGKTPLHCAVEEESSLDVATCIAQAEPKAICIPDAGGNCPIFRVCSLEMLKMMLHVNQDAIYHQSQSHDNILCQYLLIYNAQLREQVIDFLLRLKPSLVNDINLFGQCALDVAFILQRKNEINIMLRLTKDQQETKPQGNTLLHFAVYAGDIEICKQIFTRDIERLFCTNMQQKTPFDMAVEWKHCDVVRMLLPNITIDMALKARKLCLVKCNFNLLEFVAEQCWVLNNYLLPELANMVLEYLDSDLKFSKKNHNNHAQLHINTPPHTN